MLISLPIYRQAFISTANFTNYNFAG